MSKNIVVPVVVDTNVLVPSLYWNTWIMEFIRKGNLALIWNDFIYQEADEIIRRLAPVFEPRTGVPAQQVLRYLPDIFIPEYRVREMPARWKRVSPDRDDDPFIWAAYMGGAEFIISDDIRHLLILRSYERIPIGTPKQFFVWVKLVHPMEAE